MMSDERLRIEGIAQIALEVHDVALAVAFYRDVLGLEQLPIPAPPTMAFFVCGGTRLMLSLPEGKALITPGSLLYFKIAEIQSAHARLVEHGAEVVRPPQLVARMPDHDLWMTFFRDPSGNPLALMAELARAETATA